MFWQHGEGPDDMMFDNTRVLYSLHVNSVIISQRRDNRRLSPALFDVKSLEKWIRWEILHFKWEICSNVDFVYFHSACKRAQLSHDGVDFMSLLMMLKITRTVIFILIPALTLSSTDSPFLPWGNWKYAENGYSKFLNQLLIKKFGRTFFRGGDIFRVNIFQGEYFQEGIFFW